MKKHLFYKIFLIPSLMVLSGALATCSSSPEVTRYMTIGDFNAAQEISGIILDDMEYPIKVFMKSIN